MNAIKSALAVGYSEKFIAKELFPSNKHPMAALKRIITGEAELSASQATRLASLLDITVDDLLRGNSWKAEFRKERLVLRKGAYRVELTDGTDMKLYHVDSKYFVETRLRNNITLKDFILTINQMIENNEQNKD